MSENKYQSFKDFYPFYLSQHKNKTCRVLHYIGSTIALFLIVFAILTSQYVYVFVALIQGYCFAWIGHFFFEKNRPATFQYPWYSFLGDWKMFLDFILLRSK